MYISFEAQSLNIFSLKTSDQRDPTKDPASCVLDTVEILDARGSTLRSQ